MKSKYYFPWLSYFRVFSNSQEKVYEDFNLWYNTRSGFSISTPVRNHPYSKRSWNCDSIPNCKNFLLLQEEILNSKSNGHILHVRKCTVVPGSLTVNNEKCRIYGRLIFPKRDFLTNFSPLFYLKLSVDWRISLGSRVHDAMTSCHTNLSTRLQHWVHLTSLLVRFEEVDLQITGAERVSEQSPPLTDLTCFPSVIAVLSHCQLCCSM